MDKTSDQQAEPGAPATTRIALGVRATSRQGCQAGIAILTLTAEFASACLAVMAAAAQMRRERPEFRGLVCDAPQLCLFTGETDDGDPDYTVRGILDDGGHLTYTGTQPGDPVQTRAVRAVFTESGIEFRALEAGDRPVVTTGMVPRATLVDVVGQEFGRKRWEGPRWADSPVGP